MAVVLCLDAHKFWQKDRAAKPSDRADTADRSAAAGEVAPQPQVTENTVAELLSNWLCNIHVCSKPNGLKFTRQKHGRTYLIV